MYTSTPQDETCSVEGCDNHAFISVSASLDVTAERGDQTRWFSLCEHHYYDMFYNDLLKHMIRAETMKIEVPDFPDFT